MGGEKSTQPPRTSAPEPDKATPASDEDQVIVSVSESNPQGSKDNANDIENNGGQEPHGLAAADDSTTERDISVRECLDYMDYIERLSHSILVPRKVNPRVILSRSLPSSSNPSPQFCAYVLAGEERARKNIFKVEGLIGEGSNTRQDALNSLRGLVENRAAGERYDERNDGYDQVGGDEEEGGEGDGVGKKKGGDTKRKRDHDKGKGKAHDEVQKKVATKSKANNTTEQAKVTSENQGPNAKNQTNTANSARSTQKANVKAPAQAQSKLQKGSQPSARTKPATQTEKGGPSGSEQRADPREGKGKTRMVDYPSSSESEVLTSVEEEKDRREEEEEEEDDEEKEEEEDDDDDVDDEFLAKRRKNGESLPEPTGNRAGLRSGRTRAAQSHRR